MNDDDIQCFFSRIGSESKTNIVVLLQHLKEKSQKESGIII